MIKYSYLIASYCLIIISLCACRQRESSVQTGSDGYILVQDWPNLSKDFVLGNPTGLGIDSKSNIVVFHRASRVWQSPMPVDKIQENTILVLNKQTGKVIRHWGANLFIMPHGLEVDKEDNIWVTDVALHQVFKFSAEGELLLTLGEAAVPGTDANHFNLPTDVAVADDGSFYVSDGYGNSRVVKFAADGTYLLEWGSLGKESGEFKTPHGIDLDKYGNVYVADRENNRIQKFNAEGKFISLWQNSRTDQLYSVVIDHKHDQLFGIDYMTHLFGAMVVGSDIFRFDLDLTPQVKFGRSGSYNGAKARYHDVLVDDEGSIYVGDIYGNQIQKFRMEEGR